MNNHHSKIFEIEAVHSSIRELNKYINITAEEIEVDVSDQIKRTQSFNLYAC